MTRSLVAPKAAVLLSASLGLLFLAGCSGDGSPSPTATPRPPATDPTATSLPPARSLTGEEILALSDEAMRGLAVVAESQSWALGAASPRYEASAVDYYEGDNVTVVVSQFERPCETIDMAGERFAARALGALLYYRPESGATAPEEVELLGDSEIDGRPVWKIRYRFQYPSIEGPYWAESTEWVDQETFRLLRQETEIADPLGFNGQEVTVLKVVDEEPACGTASDVPPDDLRPVTSPRLAGTTGR